MFTILALFVYSAVIYFCISAVKSLITTYWEYRMCNDLQYLLGTKYMDVEIDTLREGLDMFFRENNHIQDLFTHKEIEHLGLWVSLDPQWYDFWTPFTQPKVKVSLRVIKVNGDLEVAVLALEEALMLARYYNMTTQRGAYFYV